MAVCGGVAQAVKAAREKYALQDELAREKAFLSRYRGVPGVIRSYDALHDAHPSVADERVAGAGEGPRETRLVQQLGAHGANGFQSWMQNFLGTIGCIGPFS